MSHSKYKQEDNSLADVYCFLSLPGVIERLSPVIPVLGHVIEHELLMRRFRLARTRISKVLLTRDLLNSSQESNATERKLVKSKIAYCINQVCDWGTDAFAEQDRMSSLLLGYDDMEVAEFAQCVREEMGIVLDDYISLDELYTNMTFGDVVNCTCAFLHRPIDNPEGQI